MELRSELFSYYYGDDRLDLKQINLKFLFIDKSINIRKEIYFKIDTGAMDIALNASDLGIQQTEEEFISTHEVKKVQRFGIAKNVPLNYYRYIMPMIKLGGFVLHNFPVYITFDKNGTSKLIGMSFLRLFKITIDPEYKTIEFTETQELASYKNKSMHNIDKVIPETYIDFSDQQLLESNYINTQLK